jgi:hypothetical protein
MADELAPQDDGFVSETESAPLGGASGGVNSDWRAGISDDKVRRFASRFDSPAALAEAALGFRQKLSGAVPLPRRNASDEDVATFRRALGVPDGPEGYIAGPPDDWSAHLQPDEAGQARLDGFLQVAHKAGLNQGQLDAVLGWYYDQVRGVDGSQRHALEEATESARAELARDWGPQYQANAELAVRAAEAFGGEELVELIETTMVGGVKLGDHPQFVKTFAAIGRAMREAEPLIGAGGEGGFDLERRHADLTRRLNDAIDRGHREEAERLDRMRDRVAQQLVGSGPLVGAEGRPY